MSALAIHRHKARSTSFWSRAGKAAQYGKARHKNPNRPGWAVQFPSHNGAPGSSSNADAPKTLGELHLRRRYEKKTGLKWPRIIREQPKIITSNFSGTRKETQWKPYHRRPIRIDYKKLLNEPTYRYQTDSSRELAYASGRQNYAEISMCDNTFMKNKVLDRHTSTDMNVSWEGHNRIKFEKCHLLMHINNSHQFPTRVKIIVFDAKSDMPSGNLPSAWWQSDLALDVIGTATEGLTGGTKRMPYDIGSFPHERNGLGKFWRIRGHTEIELQAGDTYNTKVKCKFSGKVKTAEDLHTPSVVNRRNVTTIVIVIAHGIVIGSAVADAGTGEGNVSNIMPGQIVVKSELMLNWKIVDLVPNPREDILREWTCPQGGDFTTLRAITNGGSARETALGI